MLIFIENEKIEYIKNYIFNKFGHFEIETLLAEAAESIYHRTMQMQKLGTVCS